MRRLTVGRSRRSNMAREAIILLRKAWTCNVAKSSPKALWTMKASNDSWLLRVALLNAENGTSSFHLFKLLNKRSRIAW
jgi:hypothetical protein